MVDCPVRTCVSALLIAAASLAQAPVFLPGDPAELEAKVVRKPKRANAGYLVVEVRNRTSTSAEPLTFDITVGDRDDGSGRIREFRHHRTGLVTWGRAGRSIRPRGKLRYVMPLPWGEATPLGEVRVDVRRASFFRGKGIDRSPVVVERVEEFEAVDNFQKLKVKKTRARLRNDSERAVDVILAVRTKRGKHPALAAARLGPGETKTVGEARDVENWIVASPTVPQLDGRFASVKVIDWSVAFPVDHSAARGALELAWRDRYRWPDTALTGKVRFAFDGPLGTAHGEAVFRRLADGRVTVAAEGLSREHDSELASSTGAVVRGLVWPTFEDIVERADLRLVDRRPDGSDVVWVRSRVANQPVIPYPVLTVREGRIVHASQESLGLHEDVSWTHDTLADGRHVPKRAAVRWPNPPRTATVIEEREQVFAAAGDLFVPEQVKRKVFDRLSGKHRYDVMLGFSEVALAGPAPAGGAPRGDGAASLRAAWERPYRHPSGGVDLRGTLKLEVAATKDNWYGREKISGKVAFEGWSGVPSAPGGPVFAGCTFRPDDDFSSDARKQVEDLLRARLGIWTRQDFGARMHFEVAFRGCELTLTGTKGLVAVAGHERIAAVLIADGLPVEVRDRSGEVHRRRFGKVRGRLVAHETSWVYADRTAVVLAQHAPVGGGRLFPKRLEYRDWFSAGWGPEVYTFSVRQPRR